MRIRSTSPIGASRSLVPLASLAVTITCGFLTAILATRPAAAQTSETASQPLRIIFFGAHPDDAEYKAGGTAAMWAARGHQVKLVSVTNGDIGHWDMAGGPLARRRAEESAEANRYREALVRRYGKERGEKIRYAEAFEICEYGRQPSEDEIRDLFPFFPEK